jgi:DNA-binding response OmpR family regulator
VTGLGNRSRRPLQAAPLPPLSAKELALLEALLKAAPAALSAEGHLEQVWDENADPITKTVQVTIGRLRRKLGEPDIIETIPGVGYRITKP